MLQELGKMLAENGVQFLDLNSCFRNHPETLYSDPWCQVNADGNALLAESIAPALIQCLQD
jgi:hypothetical protein